jgi:hypothetical protein
VVVRREHLNLAGGEWRNEFRAHARGEPDIPADTAVCGSKCARISVWMVSSCAAHSGSCRQWPRLNVMGCQGRLRRSNSCRGTEDTRFPVFFPVVQFFPTSGSRECVIVVPRGLAIRE